MTSSLESSSPSGFFASIIGALADISFYKKIAANRFSVTLRYVLLIVLLVHSVEFAFTYKRFNYYFSETIQGLEKGMPGMFFTAENKLRLLGAKAPVVLYDEPLGNFKVVYLERLPTTFTENSMGGMLLKNDPLENAFGVIMDEEGYWVKRSADFYDNVFNGKWTDLNLATGKWPLIDQNSIREFLGTVKTKVVFFLYANDYIGQLIAFFIMIALTSFFTVTHANIINFKLKPLVTVNISAYGLTAWILLNFFLTKSLGLRDSFWSMFSYLISLAYIYRALNFMAPPKSKDSDS